MMEKISRRSFMKVLGIAGAACAMTALTGCEDVPDVVRPGDGSTPLSNLTPLNGGISWDDTRLPEDPFGNVYTQGVNYTIFSCYCGWKNLEDGGFDLRSTVEYPVYQKYRKLTMKLNPYKTMDEDCWGLVKVYVDDELAGTSPTIVQKTNQTVEFEVDITGAKYIKIEPHVRLSSYFVGGVMYKTGGMILWDIKLWP